MAFFGGPVTHAGDLEAAVVAYYDGSGVVFLGPDIVQGYRAGGLPFDHYLIYTSKPFVDWAALFHLGTVDSFQLTEAEGWQAFQTLLALADLADEAAR